MDEYTWTPEHIAEARVMATFCEPVTLPASQLRALLDEVERLRTWVARQSCESPVYDGGCNLCEHNEGSICHDCGSPRRGSIVDSESACDRLKTQFPIDCGKCEPCKARNELEPMLRAALAAAKGGK